MVCVTIPETTSKVAVFNRNGRQLCSGTGGNFQPEWVAVLLRIMHLVLTVFRFVQPCFSPHFCYYLIIPLRYFLAENQNKKSHRRNEKVIPINSERIGDIG